MANLDKLKARADGLLSILKIFLSGLGVLFITAGKLIYDIVKDVDRSTDVPLLIGCLMLSAFFGMIIFKVWKDFDLTTEEMKDA